MHPFDHRLYVVSALHKTFLALFFLNNKRLIAIGKSYLTFPFQGSASPTDYDRFLCVWRLLSQPEETS